VIQSLFMWLDLNTRIFGRFNSIFNANTPKTMRFICRRVFSFFHPHTNRTKTYRHNFIITHTEHSVMWAKCLMRIRIYTPMKYVRYIAVSLLNNQNDENRCRISIQNCINREPVGYLRITWSRTGMQPQQWSGNPLSCLQLYHEPPLQGTDTWSDW